MKQTPVNRRCKKYRSVNDRAARARAKYLKDFPSCAICAVEADTIQGLTGKLKLPTPASEIHHMAGRNAKSQKHEVPQNWLPLCREHHQWVTDDSRFSAWICFAAKLFVDPATADLEYLRTTRPSRFGKVIE